MEIPILTTARLVLRPFTAQDAGPLYDILAEEGVLRYFPNPKSPSREGVGRFIDAQLRHWQERGFGWWAVESRESREMIGWNGLQYLPETDEVEVAFLLRKAYWGRGLATEGALASLAFGFERLGLKAIVAVAHPENLASRRVIEKLGMTLTEETEYFGMAVCRYEINVSNSSQDVD